LWDNLTNESVPDANSPVPRDGRRGCTAFASIANAQALHGGGFVPRDIVARATDSVADAILRGGRVAAMSIAVVRGLDTVVMKGYGMADVENEVAATARTVYRIESVTKQFTSVAVMQIVEQGKLSLDDELTKYVPNAPTHGRGVLIRHLLNHTSGIPTHTDVGGRFGRVMRARPLARLAARRDSLRLPAIRAGH
jgi:CubicO group peptidase (beta-lactamase class C family)